MHSMRTNVVQPWLFLFSLIFIAICGQQFCAAEEGFAAKSFHLPSVGGWAVSPDTETLIVSIPTTAEIVFIDTIKLEESRRLKVPFQPASLAIQKDKLFVAGRGSSYVYAIDLKSGEVVGKESIDGEPAQSLDCHPERGLLFVAGSDEVIHVIDFEKNKAIKTNATGEYLRVDPKGARFLLAGTNHPSRNVIEFANSASGRVQLQLVQVVPTAFVQKFSIDGSRLKLVDLNTNAAVGADGYLGISPDGSQYAFVAGGGWRSPSNQQRHINIAVFETQKMEAMQGGLDVGAPQVIAFHPVLPIGVAQGRVYDFHIFDAKSLLVREKITVMPDGPHTFRHNLLTFVGNGARIAALQGEHLHIIEYKLEDDERTQLQKTYGELPSPVARAEVVSEPRMRKETVSKPGNTPTTPKPNEPEKNDHVVELTSGRGKLTSTAIGTPFLTDRPYALKAIPDELKTGSMLVRNSGSIGSWLGGGEVQAKQPITGYVAIQIRSTSLQKVSDAAITKFIDAGWTKVEGFETTGPAKEVWEWVLLSRKFEAGPLKFPQTTSLRTNFIFFFD